MENDVLLQFTGFLNTPQIWKDKNPLPYSLYTLKKIQTSRLPNTLHFSPSMVLGKRMELFFQYYVTHFAEEKILVHNEQVIFNKKTLGELDFILKNSRTKEVTHVELVYKFYLFDPSIPGDTTRWIGPNRRDSFPEKLNRLTTRQFPLLHRMETLPILQRLNLDPSEIIQKLCFKANLFLPKNLSENKAYSNINPEAINGFWIKAKDFTKEDYGKAFFYSPKKPDWPVDPRENKTWFTYDEINPQINQFLEKDQAPLVWMKTSENLHQRFFIVWW